MNRDQTAARSIVSFLFSLLLLCAVGDAAAQKPSKDVRDSAMEQMKKIQEMTGGSAKTSEKVPAQDPCKLLTLSDIQNVFPAAKRSERDRRLEDMSGITECQWTTADGTLLMTVQQMYSRDSAKADLEGMAIGMTNPMKASARRNVRIETLAGVGDNAAAFVEREDNKREIHSDGAFLAVRKGPYAIWIVSQELARRDRTAALKALEQLGRTAASRL